MEPDAGEKVEAAPDRRTRRARLNRWALRARWVLFVIVLGLLLLKAFVIDWYSVPQKGMLPGIRPGVGFWARRHPYRDASQVKRGDVIIFTRRIGDGKPYTFIWRVIGLPGDRVESAGDAVHVNGQELIRERVRGDGELTIYRGVVRGRVPDGDDYAVVCAGGVADGPAG
jgi:signal peptidase I